MRSRFRTTLVSAAAAALVLSSAGLAIASSVDTAVVDVTAPTNAVTIDAGGSPAPITINASVTGKQDGTSTFEVYRDWSVKDGVFTGSNPQTFTVGPRAAQDPANTFSTSGTVAADAGQAGGTFTLSVGVFDITNSNSTGAKLSAGTAGGYQVTVVVPAPSNTPPTVAVTGFADGDTFEIGAEPTPGCDVQDAEDTNPTAEPSIDRSGVDEHGLGDVTVTCSYTDGGGLSDSASATYTIVDTGDPTITHTVSPATADGANGWYVSAPTVTFSCDDSGSGVKSCVADGTDPASASVTLGESKDAQTVSGTATDWAGNTATDSVPGLLVDLSNPTNVSFSDSISGGAHFPWGSVPAAPTCTGDDAISGLATCAVSGYSGALGEHTLVATATDNAGRTATAELTYTVDAWRLDGFYKPVDMGSTVNTVKAGSTVPLKFNVFKGDARATDNIGATFSAKQTACGAAAASDAIEEFTTTGSTSLRYDSTGQQWIQNWATPKAGAGLCYQVTMTTADGSAISANFKLTK